MADTSPVAAIPFAELGDSPNANTLSENMALALDHLVIPKFASVAARDAANPTPSTGDACYRTDVKVMQTWDGANWIDFGTRYKRRTSNQTVSSTTFINDNQLFLAMDANSVYRYELDYGYEGDTTSDFQYRFTGPTGSTLIVIENLNYTQALTLSLDWKDSPVMGSTTVAVGCFGGAGNLLPARAWGFVSTGSTAGNLQPQIALVTGTATATTKAGSWLSITQVG